MEYGGHNCDEVVNTTRNKDFNSYRIIWLESPVMLVGPRRRREAVCWHVTSSRAATVNTPDACCLLITCSNHKPLRRLWPRVFTLLIWWPLDLQGKIGANFLFQPCKLEIIIWDRLAESCRSTHRYGACRRGKWITDMERMLCDSSVFLSNEKSSWLF